MALEPVVDSIDDLPEAIQSEYKQTEEGNYILDVTPKNGYALENTAGLKKALGAERQKASQYEKQISAFGDLDPSDLQTKLERLQELEQIDPSQEADKLLETRLKSIQDQMSSKHKKELDGVVSKYSKTEQHLQKLLIDDAAKSAIIKAGGNEKTLAYMLPNVINQLSIQENDTGFSTQVRDEFGNPRIGDAQGSPMSVEQLVLEMKTLDLWQGAFPASGQSGGGIPPKAQGGTPTGSNVDITKMTNSEKSKFIAENPDKWMDLLSRK